MERELNFNNTALEKADKGFDEAEMEQDFLFFLIDLLSFLFKRVLDN